MTRIGVNRMKHPIAKTLPVSKVKARLLELVTRGEDLDEEVVITRNGKPAAVLLSYAQYQRIKGTLDVLSDPDRMAQIHASRAHFGAGRRGLSFEDVFGEPLQVARVRLGRRR